MNFLIVLIKNFLHLGSVKVALIFCLVAGIVYLIKRRKERVKWG